MTLLLLAAGFVFFTLVVIAALCGEPRPKRDNVIGRDQFGAERRERTATLQGKAAKAGDWHRVGRVQ